MSTWTEFWDMNSGGGRKEKWKFIYIEAPRLDAIEAFIERFGHDPENVACPCCGPNYSFEHGTLQGLSAYHRGCAFDPLKGEWLESPAHESWAPTFVPFEEWLANPPDDTLILRYQDF